MTSVRPAPAVVVVAYRCDDQLAGCLSALEDAASVLVVDNDAAESTHAITSSNGARYLASPGNIGFAAAVNLGLDAAWDGDGDVLLLNPDARVSGSEIVTLQDALHEPGRRVAATGPRLVGADGSPQRAAWPLPSPGQVWFDALGLTRLWRGRKFLVGAVLMLNGAALAEIGHLDERYFLYAEEADWQLRALRAGWTVQVVDAVEAIHVGGASSGDGILRNQLFHASGEAFARRWYGGLGWWLMRIGSLVASGRRSILGSAEGRRLNRRTFLLYLRGPLGARSLAGRVG
jgi:GT2 family glycosyltransferase